jgi:hypothetical protein
VPADGGGDGGVDAALVGDVEALRVKVCSSGDA